MESRIFLFRATGLILVLYFTQACCRLLRLRVTWSLTAGASPKESRGRRSFGNPFVFVTRANSRMKID
ncbi:hypothetical protein PR002_g27023 [Phytophthora rubi]|uniref:Uncharacterized protein n=1 Tax=Phytophthora rubi TaxID=129364 RepID=A0A6A3HPX6_9STRA|nr:hypothetical protein PR002_g27023 [Phytophthora rubi]